MLKILEIAAAVLNIARISDILVMLYLMLYQIYPFLLQIPGMSTINLVEYWPHLEMLYQQQASATYKIFTKEKHIFFSSHILCHCTS